MFGTILPSVRIPLVVSKASRYEALGDFSKSEFSRTNFEGADLTGADMSYANLSRAVFAGAKLDGIDVGTSWTFLTRFEGADLGGVAKLTQDQLDLACGDESTKLPAGLTMPSSWPCPSE